MLLSFGTVRKGPVIKVDDEIINAVTPEKVERRLLAEDPNETGAAGE